MLPVPQLRAVTVGGSACGSVEPWKHVLVTWQRNWVAWLV